MSTEPLPPIPADIARFTGPLLLGNLFNWGLFGVLSVQTYVYYLSFPNDRRLPKFLVVFVYLIEMVQTVLVTRDAFRVFGTRWGNMIELNLVAWIWFSIPVMTGIISCTVQLFYAWRIYTLSSQTMWISSVIVFLSLVQMVAGVWSGINAHIISLFSELQDRNYKICSVWLGGTALVDVIITASMIYYLFRSRTGLRETDAIITKFVRLTVETGLICAAFATLDLFFFVAYKNVNYHMVPALSLSKLYSNSLLVLLNTRVRIVGGRNGEPASSDATLSTMSFSGVSVTQNTTSTGTRSNISYDAKAISITITSETTRDVIDVPMVDAAQSSQDSLSHTQPEPHDFYLAAV